MPNRTPVEATPNAQHGTVLSAIDVSKSYPTPDGKLAILEGFSMQVRQGEFIAIVGPSGSGKTTLLSLLGALDAPDSGEISVADTPVHTLRGVAAADYRRKRVDSSSSFSTCSPHSPPWKMSWLRCFPIAANWTSTSGSARLNC